MKERNPFFIKGYHGPEYFCDRRIETEKLRSAVENGRDVTLLAPRRFGKTGLIWHLFHKLPDEYVTIYLDLYSIADLAGFAKAFAAAAVAAIDSPLVKAGKGIVKFFKSCRPTATATADGVKWSFDVSKSAAEPTLREAFDYIAGCGRECVIAIDEFQQVREFPETGIEALIRSLIQNIGNAHFIFAGSRRHLMQEMFALPRSPFYKSTQIMELSEIDREEYCKFAAKFFRSAKKRFSVDVFNRLYDRFDGITWYIQAVLNRAWEYAEGLSADESVDEAVDTLTVESDFTYGDLLRSQTPSEKAILAAVAKEGVVKEISGKAFIAKYDLPSPSTVRSAVENLVSRDLLYRDQRGYSVYDRIFAQWLR